MQCEAGVQPSRHIHRRGPYNRNAQALARTVGTAQHSTARSTRRAALRTSGRWGLNEAKAQAVKRTQQRRSSSASRIAGCTACSRALISDSASELSHSHAAPLVLVACAKTGLAVLRIARATGATAAAARTWTDLRSMVAVLVEQMLEADHHTFRLAQPLRACARQCAARTVPQCGTLAVHNSRLRRRATDHNCSLLHELHGCAGWPHAD